MFHVGGERKVIALSFVALQAMISAAKLAMEFEIEMSISCGVGQ